MTYGNILKYIEQ